MQIREIAENKGAVCEEILRGLPRWFGLEYAILDYIKSVENMPMYGAFERDGGGDGAREPAGFVSVEAHNPSTIEIHLLAVREAYHRHGAGRALIAEAEAHARRVGAEFLMVKTLGPSQPCAEYDGTRRFYEAMGFRHLQEIKNLWKENPCLIMVKPLAK